MRPLYPILAAMLAAVPQAYARGVAEQPQESVERPAMNAPVRQAIPRGEAPRVLASRNADDQRREPRGSRPQGDNPRTGTAVPRAARPAPDRVDRGQPAARPAPRPEARRPRVIVRPPAVVVRPPSVYSNYYGYPYYGYPRRGPLYGSGALSLGFGYRDPHGWYPYASPYAGYGYYTRPLGSFDTGELRLEMSPRDAQVYVDGYYAGTVDDFDGAFQSLTLESGPHQIDIVAPGYETMTFDVRISPGQKITYRSDLLRLAGS